MSYTYVDSDRERWVAEPHKRPERSAFARDRGRLLHSAGWRRLAGKTQVMLAGAADFPRTRMTHSLECAQVGRELGGQLGADPDLVEVGCLAHDLGHPPFGHNGEAALAQVAARIGGFEGNAQTFRLLARLEAKAYRGERSAGLNLARATLDAATKYPWAAGPAGGKFGVYPDDTPAFEWMRQGAPIGRRSFEAQIMDWSDDVAYSVHDIEDGIQAGHIQLTDIPRRAERIVSAAQEQYADRSSVVLGQALERLLRMPFWHRGYRGTHRDLARLKNLTSELVGRFSTAAQVATRAVYVGAPLGRYQADLVVPSDVSDEVAVLKAIAWEFVMTSEEVDAARAGQRQVVKQLVEALLERGRDAFDPALAGWWQEGDEDSNLRLAVDQVACLTDASVITWHRRLTSAN
ncbi:MAG: deoxyguanosinetriphosphate triphosphohydrolase [Candidatus Nanopelagicales bacterium]